MKILLITPPLTQLNTPYPATAYLKGFLGERGYDVAQADLGIELILQIFCKEGLTKLFQKVRQEGTEELSANARRILGFEHSYIGTIDAVIRFLQNIDATLAHRIVQDDWLPQASRFEQAQELDWAFGNMGIQDKARFLSTLYIEDIGDLIIECISPNFGFSRYAEQIAMSATHFDPIEAELKADTNWLDLILWDCLERHIQQQEPDVVGFSVPFPGNLYGALKCGQYLKKNHPHIKIMMGGGYPNTELRQLSEPKVFDYLDFITLDDGEAPLLKLLEHIDGERPQSDLQRCFVRENNQVIYLNNKAHVDIPHTQIGTPDYSDLPLRKYLSVIEVMNPMHRLWSDGRWNKLTIAHGCYWKRCSFCDVTLDYISRYDAAPAKLLVDRIEKIVAQTGETGFHFVDEAAPPLSLRDLAVELIQRNVQITWWTNIRFEKTFSADLCRLLAESGCIAVSGGLEVASDRLLAKMEKGVTIAQVARVTKGFTDAGIMVHAYLMYGFPTETAQETIDALEVVRQLFMNGIVQSGFWHLFTMTAHSPVGKKPEAYGVVAIGGDEGNFALNDLQHEDPTGCDHVLFSEGLKKALFNYMNGVGFDIPLKKWFDFKTPKTSSPPNLIKRALHRAEKVDAKCMNYRALWLLPIPELFFPNEETAILTFYTKKDTFDLELDADMGEWLHSIFAHIHIHNRESQTNLKMIAGSFEEFFEDDFRVFLESDIWGMLRENGLLLVRF